MDATVFDVESYANFFLALFKRVSDGQVTRVQISPNRKLNQNLLRQTLESNLLVGFNSTDYDVPMLQCAMKGMSAEQLKEVSDDIVLRNHRPRDIAEKYELSRPRCNHIDLLPIAPLKASLNTYAGRLHYKHLQDLPVDPNAALTAETAAAIVEKCTVDLGKTECLFNELKDQIELRAELSREYQRDLRSKSDAQVAEAVIAAEVEKINGARPARPSIPPGTTFRYQVPDYMAYRAPDLKDLLAKIRETDFVVSDKGSVEMPPGLANASIRLGGARYRIGIGGLHSSETRVSYVTDDRNVLIDRDVASFYPRIILNQGLYPKHLGPAFLEVYSSLVDRRLIAKRAGEKTIAESLKIAINGCFGKLGNMWSVVYAPDLLIQVTVTGQLVLLMLIDMLNSARIPVISANTDGIVIHCPRHAEGHLNEIVQRWEKITAFETEETRYQSYWSKDVNNYIAIKDNGKAKGKGLYSCPWEGITEGPPIFKLHKNPSTTIVIESVINLLRDGIPIEDTIRACRDVRKFISVRSVTGGAQIRGEQVGKSVRWYYGADSYDVMQYNRTTKHGRHNKVPKTDHSKPLMELPDEFPSDVNYGWYTAEANAVLNSIGYSQPSLFAEAA